MMYLNRLQDSNYIGIGDYFPITSLLLPYSSGKLNY